MPKTEVDLRAIMYPACVADTIIWAALVEIYPINLVSTLIRQQNMIPQSSQTHNPGQIHNENTFVRRHL